MMQVEVKNTGQFANSAVARCHIPAGETINVESGAMYQHSMGIRIDSKMSGGFLGAIKRSVSGDSFFMSHFSAPKDSNAWVDIAPAYPGDIVSFYNNPNNPTVIMRGSWLASDTSVDVQAKLGNMTTIVGGEGLVVNVCQGAGNVILSACGAIEIQNLAEGESRIVDTGHLVAYESSMRTATRKAATGYINSLTSGEGLVMEITGPGTLITQTRNPKGFASFISGLLPSR